MAILRRKKGEVSTWRRVPGRDQKHARRSFSVALLVLAGVLLLLSSCSSDGREGVEKEYPDQGKPTDTPSFIDTEASPAPDLSTPAMQTLPALPDPVSEGTPATPVSTEGPRISFDQDSAYLGEATPQQKINYEFSFQNVGNAPLVVYNVKAKPLEGC